jgi:molybdopterin-guanine dinucleotide biosynthesis protein MobB
MQAIAITGPKKSGKTTLLDLVAEALERRGKRVAIVKHSSHPIERGNTDAFWLMRPKRTIVSVCPEETAVFWPEQLSFETLVSHVRADVLLLEGGDAPSFVPRVLCLREGEEADASFLPEEDSFTVLAVHGLQQSLIHAPHFPEMDPQAAEKIAALVLEKAPVL